MTKNLEPIRHTHFVSTDQMKMLPESIRLAMLTNKYIVPDRHDHNIVIAKMRECCNSFYSHSLRTGYSGCIYFSTEADAAKFFLAYSGAAKEVVDEDVPF